MDEGLKLGIDSLLSSICWSTAAAESLNKSETLLSCYKDPLFDQNKFRFFIFFENLLVTVR